MDKIKHLGLCRWKDIKVGEVFAIQGCWTIAAKLSPTNILILECDEIGFRDDVGEQGKMRSDSCGHLDCFECIKTHRTLFSVWELGFPDAIMYRLPMAIQRLWRND